MFIGEAPGSQEDERGEPFTGSAGRLLNSLLSSAGWGRELCYISNVLKCRPPNNTKPSPKQIASCSHWLDIEIGMVQPEILVLMGAIAIYRILGPDAGTVEHLHGNPLVMKVGGRDIIVLPVYHPAAALHETAKLRFVYDDFQVLKGLIAGNDPQQYKVVDEYPNPEYIELHASDMKGFYDRMESAGLVAADTETVNDKLWSVQVCFEPGTAYFIGPELVDSFRFPPSTLVVFHNYLYDYQFIRADRFSDTMIMAYQLGLPQGLKELAHRTCGIVMRSYSDLVSGSGRENAINYLTDAVGRDWPKPEPVAELKWNNKAGKVIEKIRNPQPITRKIKRILADSVDGVADPYKRWIDIDQAERNIVESVLGPMPSSTIADIPRSEAINYAAKDADSTMRVYKALLPRIQEYGLEFTLGMDLGVLPMVQEMMDTGFALDVDYLKGLSSEYAEKMASIADELAEMAGHAFNPGSSAQVAQVVYQELGFKPTKFTDSKAISTDDRELKKINHPIVEGILKYRQQAKNKDPLADTIIEKAV